MSRLLFVFPVMVIWAILIGAVYVIGDLTDTREDFLEAIKDYQVILAAGSALGVASLTYLGVWLKSEYDLRASQHKLEKEQKTAERAENAKLAVSLTVAAGEMLRFWDITYWRDGSEYSNILDRLEEQIPSIAEASPMLSQLTIMFITTARTTYLTRTNPEFAAQNPNAIDDFRASSYIASAYLTEIAGDVLHDGSRYIKGVPIKKPGDSLREQVSSTTNTPPRKLALFAVYYDW